MPPHESDSVIRCVRHSVRIDIRDREPIERVTGPNGDEWRAHMYPSIKTEDDVFEHWAYNAATWGLTDVSQLDGWADVPAGVVTFTVEP